MNRSTPGLPVHHQLPEFTETHVHRVSDAKVMTILMWAYTAIIASIISITAIDNNNNTYSSNFSVNI